MEIVRLLASNGSYAEFEEDWKLQCSEVGEECDSFGEGTSSIIKTFAEKGQEKEWAIGLRHNGRFMAVACAIRTMQKGFIGWVLRIREVTVCPLLDYGNLDEKFYSETLVAILDGALKLSESELVADHIKLHLRSPSDAVFFRAFGNTLDSKGVFAATESHGSWLTISKVTHLHVAK